MDKRTKILLIGILTLLLFGLFVPPQTISLRAEEPRRAVVAMEMMLTGDYISPHINGWPYYNKPPVFNWALVAAFQVFQSCSEWVVRFPSLFAFVLTAVLHFFAAMRYIGKKWALFSSLAILTSAEILVYGSTQAGEIDLFFSFLIYAQVICIFMGLQRSKWSYWILGSFAIAAIATLTKGLPAIAFQSLTLLAMAVGHRTWKVFFRWDILVGSLLFLTLVVGYFVRYNAIQGDGWIYAVNLYKEAAQRTGLESESSSLLLSSVTFPLQYALLLLPWAILLPLVFLKKVRKQLWKNPFLRFCILFTLGNIALYWFTAELRLRYIYMFVPAGVTLCVMAGKIIEKHWLLVVVKGFGALLLGGLIVLGISARFIQTFSPFEHVWHFTLSATLIGGAILLMGYKSNVQWMVWPLAAMSLFKFSGNFLYYDSLNASKDDIQRYVNDIPRVTKAAEGHTIHLYGPKPHRFVRDASVGPYKMEEVTLETAMLVAYQIPYYITRAQQQVMDYQTALIPGEYYVARKPDVTNENVKILEVFFDDWVKVDMVLFVAL